MSDPSGRSPETVLDDLYETGRRWIDARIDQRRHGASSIAATVGDNPPDYIEVEADDRAAGEASRLAGRFRALVREFLDGIEAQ